MSSLWTGKQSVPSLVKNARNYSDIITLSQNLNIVIKVPELLLTTITLLSLTIFLHSDSCIYPKTLSKNVHYKIHYTAKGFGKFLCTGM